MRVLVHLWQFWACSHAMKRDAPHIVSSGHSTIRLNIKTKCGMISKFASVGKGLVTNYGEGGYKTGGGGGMWSFTPTKRGGGAEKVSAMLKGRGGRHTKFWGSFYMVA